MFLVALERKIGLSKDQGEEMNDCLVRLMAVVRGLDGQKTRKSLPDLLLSAVDLVDFRGEFVIIE
jgi:hypothetical protein